MGLKRIGHMKNGIQKYENASFRRGYGYLVDIRGVPVKSGFEHKADAEAWRDEIKRKKRLGELANPKLADATVGERGEQWLENALLGFEHKADAEAWRDEIKRKKRLGELANPKLADATVGERGEQWLENALLRAKESTDAEAWRDEIKRKKRLGELANPKLADATVGERGEQWLENALLRAKESTRRKYRQLWERQVAPTWADVRVSRVLNSNVQTWVTALSKQYGGGTVRDALSILRRILETAVKDRAIPWNPCEGISLPKVEVQKERRYLTMPELLTLSEAADRRRNKYGTLVLTMGTTGMRFGEIRALRVKNIDFRECRIRVCENAVPDTGGINVDTPKNGETRIVPFPKRLLLDRLKAKCSGKGEDDLVFERPERGNTYRPIPQTPLAGSPQGQVFRQRRR